MKVCDRCHSANESVHEESLGLHSDIRASYYNFTSKNHVTAELCGKCRTEIRASLATLIRPIPVPDDAKVIVARDPAPAVTIYPKPPLLLRAAMALVTAILGAAAFAGLLKVANWTMP